MSILTCHLPSWQIRRKKNLMFLVSNFVSCGMSLLQMTLECLYSDFHKANVEDKKNDVLVCSFFKIIFSLLCCCPLPRQLKLVSNTGSLRSSWKYRAQHIIKSSPSLPPNVQFHCWHRGELKVGTQEYTGFSLQFDLIRLRFRFSQDTMWESSFEQLTNQPTSSKWGIQRLWCGPMASLITEAEWELLE